MRHFLAPCLTDNLLSAAKEQRIPCLPGVASASEVLLAMEYGLLECKLFQATVVGGVGALNAFNAPFRNVRFCPTGGVSSSNYRDFLALPNVMCVGGSWIAPTNKAQSGDWQGITALCKEITAYYRS